LIERFAADAFIPTPARRSEFVTLRRRRAASWWERRRIHAFRNA
jgi:hypothetical protein